MKRAQYSGDDASDAKARPNWRRNPETCSFSPLIGPRLEEKRRPYWLKRFLQSHGLVNTHLLDDLDATVRPENF